MRSYSLPRQNKYANWSSQRLHVPRGSPTAVPIFINPSALPSHNIHSPNRQGLRLATAPCYTVALPRNLTLSISRYHSTSYSLVQCSPDIAQQALMPAQSMHKRLTRFSKWIHSLRTSSRHLSHSTVLSGSLHETPFGHFHTTCASLAGPTYISMP